MILRFPAFVHKDPKSDYGISFPQFSGCVTAGETLEEALRLAEEALQFHIDGLLEDGDEIPPPFEFTAALAESKKQRAGLVFITAQIPGKAKRINITLEETLLSLVDSKAEKRGMSRSAFLAEGARRFLEESA